MKNIFKKTTVETANAMARTKDRKAPTPDRTIANAGRMSGLKKVPVVTSTATKKPVAKTDRLAAIVASHRAPFDKIRDAGRKVEIQREEQWRKSATATAAKSPAPSASRVHK